MLLSEQLDNLSIDLAVLTEIRHKDTPEDKACLNQSELMQNNFTVRTQNSSSQMKGGGIALIHKKSPNVQQLEQGNTPTIEYAVWNTIANNTPIHLIGLYHLPPTDGMTATIFLDEITELLMVLIPRYNNMMLLGDFNMHIEDISNLDNIIFNDTMEALGLIQYVKSLTHKQGNILDLIFTEANSQLRMSNCQVNNYMSNHAVITTDTNISRKRPPLRTKLIRDNSKLTKENMQFNFKEPTIEDHLGLSHTYDQFNTELQNMLDNMVPLKEIKTRDKPHKPYNTKFIQNQWKIVKTRERTWQKYREQPQWQAYKKERNIYNRLLKYHKKQCITHQVHENNKSTKCLFKLVNKLTNSKKENPLPNKPPK